MSRVTGRLSFAIAAALAAGIAGAAAVKWAAVFDDLRPGNRVARSAGMGANGNGNADSKASAAQPAQNTYIVVFAESALAGYRGGVAGLPAAPTMKQGRNRNRPDLKSPEALAYLGFLDHAQQGHEGAIRQKLGHALRVKLRMKHAINAITLELTAAEAASIQNLSGVSLIEPYREYRLATDLGPTLIGAPAIWQGSYPGATGTAQGEGIVVGVLDTGINFGSPSFAGIDPVDGYHHVNPLGAGIYLGTCAAGGVDAGRCTDKLIGAYDFVCNVAPDPGFPGETTCNTAAKYRESPGGTDTNGHGSHTASTAAGNRRDVTYRGAQLRISGVAPRANIVAYDVCYDGAAGQGGCPNVATLSAVNQAVADGVDVINFSISGGKDPWSDSVSMAFLNATNAGIYVATAAGNDGPAPGTTSHAAPWVGTTAASNSGRAGFSYALNVTGPGEVPADLAPLLMTEGKDGVALTVSLPGTTPMKVSSAIDAVDDGCAAYPASTFQGAIAVIRRGTCTFSIKANNAAAAGAVAMVIANNQAGGIAPSVPGTTIPAFSVTQAEGNAVRDFATAHPGAKAGISYPPLPVPNVVDALAAFSSRGPAGTYNLIKPNITAPGVSILAAVSNTTGVGDDDLVELMSGTSMASPHHAGAAALLRQLKPTWSVPEMLSAMQMTAKVDVYKEDTVTLGNPFDRGSGRIQLERAANAGLVLDETNAKFVGANPATGGEPANLNLASMVNRRCVDGCTFTRTFRNTKASRQTWTAKLQALAGAVWPSRFTINPGETRELTIRVVTAAQVPDSSWAFGSLRLLPDNAGVTQPNLALPIAVAVPPPVITLSPATVSASVVSGNNTSASFFVRNVGGYPLSFSVDNTGTGVRDVVVQAQTGANAGFRSSQYTDVGANPAAEFAADDFALPTTTQLTSLVTDGFTNGGVDLGTATSLGWFIYADSAGKPAGNPQVSPGTAVWSYTSAPLGTGVSISDSTIGLDLAAAGQNVTLAPGKYWLVVYARTSLGNRWIWFTAGSGNGSFKTISVSSTGAGAWSTNTSSSGLDMQVKGNVQCGAAWLGAATPTMGRLNGGASSSNVVLQIPSSGLATGTYDGYVCFSSNDPVRPKIAGRVNLVVKP
jgi:hypothetical protein